MTGIGMTKRSGWTKTITEHGQTVRLFERGGVIYRSVKLSRVTSASGKPRTRQDVRSLKHSDRSRAEAQAKALCKALATAQLTGYTAGADLTLEQVRDLYLHERKSLLTVARQGHIRKSFRLLVRHLGDGFKVADLGPHQMETYTAARQSGALVSTNGRHIRQRVRAATVAKEIGALHAVLNWAATFRRDGKPLITANPLRGVALPSEPNPIRPVATRERFDKLLEQADGIDATGRFRTMLQVAWFTGRRLGSIVALRACDLHLTREQVQRALADAGMDEHLVEHWPAAVTWSAEADKEGAAWIVPIPEQFRAALAAYLKERAVVGTALLFPAERAADKPVSKETSYYWFHRAETLAKLPRQTRGGWHTLRRAWATARKHMPLQDVMAAGGWRDATSLQRAYQQADPATVRAVMDVGA
jgi:integrase